jgi:hypothetical protein
MYIRKSNSKQRTASTKSISRSIKRSSYRGISAPHMHSNRTTNHPSSSSAGSMNASWDHFDAAASCCNHAKEEQHQTIDDRRGPERKERLLKLPRPSRRSIDADDSNPFRMPNKKKNMLLLENDLELKLLLQQLHESTEFVGTINPLYHSHYLSGSPNKDHSTSTTTATCPR